jgi:hypothetical protein
MLREAVVNSARFDGCDRVLFHIDEAMSWKAVRNLRLMPPLLLIIRNLWLQGKAPDEVIQTDLRQLPLFFRGPALVTC